MKKNIFIIIILLLIINIQTVSAEKISDIADFSLAFSPQEQNISGNRKLALGRENVRKVLNNQSKDTDYLAADIAGILLINGSFISNIYVKMQNNTALVPIRIISESFDYQVDWNQKTKTAKISNSETVIYLKENDNFAMKNGEKIELTVGAKTFNGSIYVPLRFVADAFGLLTNFDNQIIYKLPIVSVTEKFNIKVSLEEAVDYSRKKSNEIIKNAHKIEDESPDYLEEGAAEFEREYFSRFYKISLKIPKGILSDSKKYFITYYIDKYTGMVYENYGNAKNIFIVETVLMQ